MKHVIDLEDKEDKRTPEEIAFAISAIATDLFKSMTKDHYEVERIKKMMALIPLTTALQTPDEVWAQIVAVADKHCGVEGCICQTYIGPLIHALDKARQACRVFIENESQLHPQVKKGALATGILPIGDNEFREHK